MLLTFRFEISPKEQTKITVGRLHFRYCFVLFLWPTVSWLLVICQCDRSSILQRAFTFHHWFYCLTLKPDITCGLSFAHGFCPHSENFFPEVYDLPSFTETNFISIQHRNKGQVVNFWMCNWNIQEKVYYWNMKYFLLYVYQMKRKLLQNDLF